MHRLIAEPNRITIQGPDYHRTFKPPPNLAYDNWLENILLSWLIGRIATIFHRRIKRHSIAISMPEPNTYYIHITDLAKNNRYFVELRISYEPIATYRDYVITARLVFEIKDMKEVV